MNNLKTLYNFSVIFFLLLIFSVPTGLLALDSTSMDEALSKPVIEKRLNMTIGVLGNSEGLTFQSAHGFTTLAKDLPAKVDTVVAIASMTKLVTTVAALQLYEEGKLDLDAPVDIYVESLSPLKILTGFNDDNEPILVSPKRRPTVRELMSHTSGFVYSMWNSNAMIAEEVGLTGDLLSGKEMIVNAPLAFEPGTRWEYGIGTDWLGVIVENISGMTLAKYFEENIFIPLQMEDSFYEIPEDKIDRVANLLFRDNGNALFKFLSLFSESNLIEIPFMSSPRPLAKYSSNYYSGGGNLYSTLPDYSKLLQCLLNDGMYGTEQILSPTTIDMIFTSEIDSLGVGVAKTQAPLFTNDIDMSFGAEANFGLGLLLHPSGTEFGRGINSGSWGGLFNTYFWIDREADVYGIFATQVAPFFDQVSIETLQAFETAAYKSKSE
jgi:CubicO group peptidase (beta-lactamase class C family)